MPVVEGGKPGSGSSRPIEALQRQSLLGALANESRSVDLEAEVRLCDRKRAKHQDERRRKRPGASVPKEG
jgi:hypothetical protein